MPNIQVSADINAFLQSEDEEAARNALGIDAATATLTNKTISGASNTLSAIGNGSLSNSSVTIAGTAVSLGGSITQTAMLDSIGSTRGSLLYRGEGGWAVLTPGTSGHLLRSNGSGADPSYVASSGAFDAASPPSIGETAPNQGVFTSLSADSLVVGQGTMSSAGMDGAGTMALRDGAVAQSLAISRSYVDGSNYSQVRISPVGGLVYVTIEEMGSELGLLLGFNFVGGSINAAAYTVGSTQVVAAQQAGIADVATSFTGSDTVDLVVLGAMATTLNNLLFTLRTHGLIAT